MKYDFYMFCATPEELQRKYSKLLSAFNMEETAAQKVALFRDPKVVEAIATASDEVRECFLRSGFELTSYDRGIRGGGFPVEDTEARSKVLAQLRENLEALPEGTDWNGFDVDAFLAVADAAQPVTRVRKKFAEARRAILPVLKLDAVHRISSRVVSRALSKPAPGI
ncbi:MAG: hypothetical protein LJE62_10440 [Silicimonas sp.]|nr:hypothetical protein [Silicimonas sp.]